MSEEDVKRYIGIVTEEFKHHLNLAIEGLTGKIESIEDRLNKRISSVEKNLKSVEKSLKQEIKELRDELIAYRDNTEVHVQRARAKKRA